MKRTPLSLLLAGSLLALIAPLQSAPLTILPALDNHTVIAQWGGAEFWSNPGPGGAPIAGVSSSGDFALSSSKDISFIQEAVLMPGRNASVTITASNFTGQVPRILTFQFVASSALTTLNLSIGDTTYTLGQAALSQTSDFAASGWNDARYQGSTVGPVTLYNYSWDLNALGFSGEDFSSFSFAFMSPSPSYSLYDIQISTSAVPEPSTYALIIGALLVTIILRRNQKAS